MTLNLNNLNNTHMYCDCDTHVWVGSSFLPKCSVWYLYPMIKPDDWHTFESVGTWVLVFFSVLFFSYAGRPLLFPGPILRHHWTPTLPPLQLLLRGKIQRKGEPWFSLIQILCLLSSCKSFLGAFSCSSWDNGYFVMLLCFVSLLIEAR